MTNLLKIISASVLVLSICITVFSSCSIKDEKDDTTTTTVRSTDYTYNNEQITIQEQTQFVPDVPPVPTDPPKKESETNAQTATTEIIITQKAVDGGTVDEIQSGLNLVTKTTPVVKGNAATIMIQGTPNATYSIETDGDMTSGENLNNAVADSMGFASWTFQTNEYCESGEKKIIIREINSDKYIQTSIIIQ